VQFIHADIYNYYQLNIAMNVILLSGLWDWFPSRTLGPYLLRHRLERAGHKTQVIDHCQEYTGKEIFEFIEHFITEETVCLGISTTFWQDVEKKFWNDDGGMPPNMYQATELMKSKYPKVKIVLGGAGVRYINKQLDNVDALVVGEAEDIFPELISHYRTDAQEPGNFVHSINKKKYYNKPNNKTYSVETCDFAFQEHDAIMPGETLPMETARGCIFKCKFCAFPHLGKKKFDYIKPLDGIKQQLIDNYERWGTQDYMMMDDTFNDSEYKIDSFLEMTKTLPFELKYTAYIRADLVHRFKGQDLKLLDSGLEGTIFGIESLHPYASTAVGKGWSGKYARDYVPHLVHNVWKDQVNVMLGLIIGLPQEKQDSILQTLKWLNENDLHAAFAVLQIQTPSSLSSKSLDSVSFLSEFDRNYAEYGYKFDNRGVWHLDDWNFLEALDFRKTIMPRRRTARLNPWLAQSVKVLGQPMSRLINPPMRGQYFMLLPEIVRLKNKFVADYKKLLLTLKR
jgi:hypothetical protein